MKKFAKQRVQQLGKKGVARNYRQLRKKCAMEKKKMSVTIEKATEEGKQLTKKK